MKEINTKVYPSAGHWAKDSGAVANGYIERDEMDKLRNMIVARLKARGHAYNTDDNSESNRVYQGRIRKELRTGDVVMDLHLNAGRPEATGVEVYISQNAGTDSKKLAKEAVDGLAKIMGIANRGVKTDNQSQHSRIGILNLRGTAVLIEFAFITNKSDMAKYKANVGKIADFLTELLIKYDKNG
ncbi:N-acetylmuramoyl-L-alanine amidase [Ornithobacterium rhinotracheale]|uniref:N-acetylmuramoyl-L-alanine amidase n=1 Tax=Ornithobacterium rhinotracheale TaxID=28251 RepID=UPI00129CD084|nr:N-acetylmuramoyl-L-alanine amidase [Ornithobacterium rhinotracheale]MRJ09146.1 N-acetylmuramoyl-L-alanine amidase [Ornithobacterium rhinotracheale]UOH77269.1 N-acetylmuramoyl-L-alanine amidase [Ornithobacterium rhinotracheale]